MDEQIREIIFFKYYATDFIDTLPVKVAKKIYWTIDLLRSTRFVPRNYLKSIENADGLWELRIEFGGDIFRIFCFFDEGNLVVLVNGFQKKSNRTPKREIERALRIKDEYYTEKKERKNT